VSTSFIDEYLVKLGASVDASGMQRFHQALREATAVADASAASIAGSFFKAQTEIVGGFLAIGSAALGLVDKVAIADQSYRLFALHMYMSKDAARSLKVAMDALGEPLENLTWDKELRDRTHQLIEDQRAMAPDGDFDAQMKKVRDIRFEFTRMEVEGQYLAMHVVDDFMKALGLGPDELLGKLQKFNDWVTHNLPQISQKIVTLFMPVWMDLKDVFSSVSMTLAATGTAFTNLVGLLTGDSSIEGTTFNFEKFAKALTHIVHGFAVFAEAIANVEEMLAHLVSALALVATGNFKDAGTELGEAFHAVTAKAVGGVIGGAAGGALGSLVGPLGTAAGSMGGAALGSNIFDKAFGGIGTASTSGDTSVHALIDKYAQQLGVNSDLAHALAVTESGERQFDKSGALVKGTNPDGSKTSATGAFQLINSTAKALGVDSGNTEDNVKGGITLFAHLLRKYQDTPTAIAAYHDGEARVSAALAGKATISDAAQREVASVMGRAGETGDVKVGSITIHITKPNATNADVGNVVVSKLRDMQNKKVQRNLAEFQDLSWST
jgi:Transglycosylase SLT domain